MTKREKILLVVLGLLVMLFLPNYFITPRLVGQIADARVQYQTLSVAQDAYLQKLQTLPNLRQYRAILDTDLANKLPTTKGLVKTYELHYLFTELARKNNIEVQSLQLGSFTDFTAAEPTEEQLAQFANMLVGITIADFAQTTGSAVKLQSIPVSLTISGTRSDILALVDDLTGYSDHLVIGSISIPMNTENGAVTTSLSITVYVVSTTGGTKS